MNDAEIEAAQRALADVVFPRLLALTLRTKLGDHEDNSIAIPCFAVEVGEQLFLVTAGHWLDELDELVRRGGKVLAGQLFDRLYDRPDNYRPLPFAYEDCTRAQHVDDPAGADVGVLHIDPFTARGIRRAGIRPFTPSSWSRPPAAPDHLLMAGFPAEWTEETRDHAGKSLAFRFCPAVIFLDHADAPTSMESPGWRRFGRPWETQPYAASLRSFKGMSGGPVFAMRKEPDGSYRCWLYGLQTGVLSASKVCVFMSFEIIGAALEHSVAAASRCEPSPPTRTAE